MLFVANLLCGRLSVGFAEMASNYQVDWGRSNRDCPAKRLALLLGQIFFQDRAKIQKDPCRAPRMRMQASTKVLLQTGHPSDPFRAGRLQPQ